MTGEAAGRGRGARFLTKLDELCRVARPVRERRDDLSLIAGVLDYLDQGHVLEAKVTGRGVLITSTDIASETIGFVFHNGHALGFEGTAGELVIMVDFIQQVRPNPHGGVDIELDSGERIWLGCH